MATLSIGSRSTALPGRQDRPRRLDLRNIETSFCVASPHEVRAFFQRLGLNGRAFRVGAAAPDGWTPWSQEAPASCHPRPLAESSTPGVPGYPRARPILDRSL